MHIIASISLPGRMGCSPSIDKRRKPYMYQVYGNHLGILRYNGNVATVTARVHMGAGV